jgi:TolB-like protein
MPNTSRLLVVLFALTGSHLLRAQQNELRSLATGLAKEIAASGKKAVAVVDFTDLQGNPTELGRFLAEEFAVALTRTHSGFEVIDRTHLKAIITEHKLAATGLIDPTTAKKLGQIVGADALLTGSMTPFSESVRVTVKVLATDTARIIAADTTDLPKTATINQLIGNAIGQTSHTPSGDNRPPLPNASPSASPGSPLISSSPVAMSAEFQYELIECKAMAGSVRCSFQITNRGSDRTLSQFCGKPAVPEATHTKAFDNFGNETFGDSCTIANRGNGVGYNVEANLVSGVPVPASVLFSNLGTSASSLSLVNILGWWHDDRSNGHVSVSFRNVPIIR